MWVGATVSARSQSSRPSPIASEDVGATADGVARREGADCAVLFPGDGERVEGRPAQVVIVT